MKNAFAAGVLLLAGAGEAGAVCYVSPSGTGDGSSWPSATSNLESVLRFSACSEIHVAAGSYTPRAPSPSEPYDTGSFNVRSGTKLLGGYAGTGADPDIRDPSTYVTILSGDYGNDDVNASTSRIDWSVTDIRGTNALHVLTLKGESESVGDPITESTVIDGFVITGGYAHIDGKFDDEVGGGLSCSANKNGAKCSPLLQNLIFAGNYADDGGAMANVGENGGESSPRISNCRFTGNSAEGGGGAVLNEGVDGTASPSILASTFDSNDAGFGGAIYNEGWGGQTFPFIQNTTFANNATNFADGRGAVIFNDAGRGGVAGAFIINSTSSGNLNQGTSAFENVSLDDDGYSEIFASNSILWDSESGTEVIDNDSASEFDHSIIRDGCPETAGWCSHTYSNDPALGALQANAGILPSFMPDASSVAIDNGTDNPAICPASDERGVSRPQGSHCDIGAVERRATD